MDKLVKQNFEKLFRFSPYIILFTFFALFLNTVRFPGFTKKYFLIDADILFAAAITSLLFFSNKSRLLKLIFRINIIFVVILLISYIFYSYQEGSHYTNYVLATYKLHLEGLIILLLFSFSLFILGMFKNDKRSMLGLKNIGQLFGIFLIIYTLLANFKTSFQKSINGNSYIFTHLRDSYDQKMQSKWGEFYNYMVFVKNNTPEDSDIIIPPKQIPWLKTGSVVLVRYFLYPRNLIQYDSIEIPDLESIAKGTNIMVAWGDWNCDLYICNNWPQQKIKAEHVIYKDPKTFTVKEEKENIIYDPKDTTNPYGLLKI